eukprot:3023636-Rhodomonas_salina.1
MEPGTACATRGSRAQRAEGAGGVRRAETPSATPPCTAHVWPPPSGRCSWTARRARMPARWWRSLRRRSTSTRSASRATLRRSCASRARWAR